MFIKVCQVNNQFKLFHKGVLLVVKDYQEIYIAFSCYKVSYHIITYKNVNEAIYIVGE